MLYSSTYRYVLTFAVALTGPAWALHDQPAPSGPPLTLHEAALLATQDQPALRARRAAVEAAAQDSIAAAQLPDPKLSAGLTDLTLSGPDRFTFTEESNTQVMLSVMQELPRARKRELLGERGAREAQTARAALALKQAELQRDAQLAWLEVYMPEAQKRLAEAQARELESELAALDIAYRAGRARQADVLAGRVDLQLLRDRIAGYSQMSAHSRNVLARWIGQPAWRALPEALPARSPPLPLAQLLERLHQHPQFTVLREESALAQTDIALAEQAYRPDWSVGVGYGLRPRFPDYLSLQVGMDLPYFTAKRQDRRLAASRSRLEQADALIEDLRRELEAQLRFNVHDWRQLQQRIAGFDRDILPQALARTESARLAYQSGSGDFNSVLLARRAVLDVRMQRLDLELDQARHQVQLHYLAPPLADVAAGEG